MRFRRLKYFVLLQSLVLIIIFATLIYEITKQINKEEADTELRQYSLHSTQPTPYEDLNRDEVLMIKKYLTNVLQLTDVEKAHINESYLYNVRLEEPWNKGHRNQANRFAIAIVFHGNVEPPVVKEYRVGALLPAKPEILTHEPTRAVSFQKRPLSSPEFRILNDLVNEAAAELTEIFKKLYNATPQVEGGQLGSDVLIHQYTSTTVTEHNGESRIRNTWFRFNRNIDPFYQYPIDFQMRVLHDGVDVRKWKIDQIWFRGKLFKSTKDLLLNHATVSDRVDHFKPIRAEKYSNKVNDDWKQNVYDALKVDKDNNLIAKHWRLKVAFRSETGIRLFRVTYKNKLVAHELGLSETATVYHGYTPYMKRMFSIESMFGVGAYTFNLSPGIDCPKNAIFFSAWIIQDFLPRQIDRAVCAFTQQLGESTALTVRSATTLFNYDYVFDYIFFEDGVMEVTVTASGNIHVDTIDVENKTHIDQGFAILTLNGTSTNIYAPFHHHFFHFKADLDIVDATNNLFANIEDPGLLMQAKKQLMTEQYDAELKLKSNEESDYYLSQCASKKKRCCYRIVNHAASKNPQTPKMFAFERSITWSK